MSVAVVIGVGIGAVLVGLAAGFLLARDGRGAPGTASGR